MGLLWIQEKHLQQNFNYNNVDGNNNPSDLKTNILPHTKQKDQTMTCLNIIDFFFLWKRFLWINVEYLYTKYGSGKDIHARIKDK